MNSKLPLSVCLISGAEARRIGKALASVQSLASEIIVVLNADVQDGTEQVATQHGAKVYREPWKGFAAQRNSATQKATQPWVLALDADEELPPALQQELRALLSRPDVSGGPVAYDFPRCTLFCGRWIRHGDWYPDRAIRLWQKGKAEWAGAGLHEKLQFQGALGHLKQDLWHYSFENIDHLLRKITQYSSYFAEERIAQGKKVSAWDWVVRPGWRFIRGYVIRLGFLDGWQGYFIACLTASFTLTRYAKVLERQSAENK